MRTELPTFTQSPDEPDWWVTEHPVDVGVWPNVEIIWVGERPGAQLLEWLDVFAARTPLLTERLGEELLLNYDREASLGLGVDAQLLPPANAAALAAAMTVEAVLVEDTSGDGVELTLVLPWDDMHLVTATVNGDVVEAISFDG